ncbi:MAG: hypothetical protein ACOYJK_05695 [Prevotella sp.]|jgi:hypothetical protein
MKRDLRLLLAEVGKKMKQEPQHFAADLNHVSVAMSRHHVHLSRASLKKLWDVLSGKRKLSAETLDKLALLTGFQDWQDLLDALHGEVDASVNYEEGKDR